MMYGWGRTDRPTEPTTYTTQLKGLHVKTSPCPGDATPETTWEGGVPKWICVVLAPEMGVIGPGDSGGMTFGLDSSHPIVITL